MSDSCSVEEKIKQRIRIYPDFPKPGIDFKDVFPLFKTPSLLGDVTKLFAARCRDVRADAVVGLDSRGFLFGPPLAHELGCSFAPARKRGKLPGECVSRSYSLEYGDDSLEMQRGCLPSGTRVAVVDDLLATGGTMEAACGLAGQAGLEVVACLVVIELTGLKGRDKLPPGVDTYSIVQYEF